MHARTRGPNQDPSRGLHDTCKLTTLVDCGAGATASDRHNRLLCQKQPSPLSGVSSKSRDSQGLRNVVCAMNYEAPQAMLLSSCSRHNFPFVHYRLMPWRTARNEVIGLHPFERLSAHLFHQQPQHPSMQMHSRLVMPACGLLAQQMLQTTTTMQSHDSCAKKTIDDNTST
jgi:hypothetical protein